MKTTVGSIATSLLLLRISFRESDSSPLVVMGAGRGVEMMANGVTHQASQPPQGGAVAPDGYWEPLQHRPAL